MKMRKLLFAGLGLVGLIGGAALGSSRPTQASDCQDTQCEVDEWGSESCVWTPGSGTYCGEDGGSCVTMTCDDQNC